MRVQMGIVEKQRRIIKKGEKGGKRENILLQHHGSPPKGDIPGRN
jgi:hypothetical protein